ncbi:MAG: PAS domain-containing protein [Legionellales bacterium]|nr:PAS domain-containing protein [Legionellales bacterium]
MKLEALHSVLKRQLTKAGFTKEELANEKMQFFISRVNQEYIDGDQGRYIKERALEVSSFEMKEMYETIKHEKSTLELLLNDLTKKDKELNEKNVALTLQRNYATSLITSIADMLFVINKDLTIVDVNTSTIKILSTEKAAILSTPFSNLFENIAPLLTLLQDADSSAEENTFINFSTEMKLTSTKTIPVLFSASVVYDAEGKKQNIICTVKDISALRRLEKENAEKISLLAHTGRLAALGEMATGIAHELNQPLSIIHSNMQTFEMLGKELSEEDLKEITASSIRQVERAAKIIDHMRSFARQKKDAAEKIDLTLPIDAAVGMFDEQFRLHSIQIFRNYQPNLPPICVEQREIEQIVVNLLSNARYAVELKREKSDSTFKMQIIINVTHLDDSQYIIFEVKDNGIGMSQTVLAQCMDPFFTTKPVGEGTGLGLPIIYNIIKNMNGKMEMESEPGQGTTVRIMLPIGE